MTKRKKNRTIGARISSELYEEIAPYLTVLDVSIGHLIRQSLKEYMWSHPLDELKNIKQHNATKETE